MQSILTNLERRISALFYTDVHMSPQVNTKTSLFEDESLYSSAASIINGFIQSLNAYMQIIIANKIVNLTKKVE